MKNGIWREISKSGYVFLLLFYSYPLRVEATVPMEYIGHWRGVICKGKIEQHQRMTALAIVHKDIGHECGSFEFDIQPKGAIKGRGAASYWFNVSAPTHLVVTSVRPAAYLEGKIKKLEFTIEGEVKKGGVFIRSKTSEKLSLINAGDRQDMEAWNVFGSERAQWSQKKGQSFLGWKGVIKKLGMQLEWRAVKEGLIIDEIKTPSPDYSFLSTDALIFRAKVEGSPPLTRKIAWKSEDGKIDKVKSGNLNPGELKNSPDYPATPPLKPDPQPALEGRGGKLSYKITASVSEGENKQQVSVLIQQDEADQLRQEYVDMKKKRVPAREELTQAGSIYNTGDYSWAIVNSRMAEGYQIIAENYVPHPANINSAYRNPVHNHNIRPRGAEESQHVYGTAVDIQTVAIGHAGAANEEDWKILRKVSEIANPTYTERLKESGPGHVHVDWRPR